MLSHIRITLLLLLFLNLVSCKHQGAKKETELASNKSAQNEGGNFSKVVIENEVFNRLNLTKELEDQEYLIIKVCSQGSSNCEEQYVRDRQYIVRGLEPGLHLVSLSLCKHDGVKSKCKKIIENYQLVQQEYEKSDILEIDKAIIANDKRKHQVFSSILLNLNQHKEEVSLCVSETNINSSNISSELNEYVQLLASLGQLNLVDYLDYFEAEIKTPILNSGVGLGLVEQALDNKYRASVITWFGSTGHWSDPFGHSTVLLEKIDKSGVAIESVYLSYPYGYDSPEEEAKYHTDKGKDGKAKIRVADIRASQFEEGKNWFVNSIYDRSFYDLDAEDFKELRPIDPKIPEQLLKRRKNVFKEKWKKDFEFYKFQANISDPEIKVQVENIEIIENYLKKISEYNNAFNKSDWDTASNLLDESLKLEERFAIQFYDNFKILGNNCACSVNKLLLQISGAKAFKSPKYLPIQPRAVRKKFQGVFKTYNPRNVTIKSLTDTLAHNRAKELHELKPFKKSRPRTRWRGLRLAEEQKQNVVEYDEINDRFAQCVSKSLQKYELELHQLAELFDYYNRIKTLFHNAVPASSSP